jgi:branched-chain amino acid transport system ATP-binding protein
MDEAAERDAATERDEEGSTDSDGLVDVTGMESYEINRLGLARAFQINNAFERLTVLENVRVARIGRDDRTLDATSVAATDDELNEAAHRVLELSDVDAFYGNSHVLFDLSLAVEENEVVVLIGRNGAGKTTTLRGIVGTVPRREGRITY